MTKNKNKTTSQKNNEFKKTQNEKTPYATSSQDREEFGRKDKDTQKHRV